VAAREFLGRRIEATRPESNIVELGGPILLLQPDLRLLSIATAFSFPAAFSSFLVTESEAFGLPSSVEKAQLVQIRKNAKSTLN
jgi:hypothetical protein